MESQAFIENWRAHVSNYQKKLKQKNGICSPEEYCKKEGIDLPAFHWWLEYINQEDKFTYYCSFATEYLERARTSLELLNYYLDLDPNLRMPLKRDAIISYAALFGKSKGRVSPKWQLEANTFVPQHLQDFHRKICEYRDVIIAHCDLNPRDPRVTPFGIVLRGKGFYGDDYKALIPKFKELIETVMNNLKLYVIQEKLSSAEEAFQNFNPPPEALKDPGKPIVR